MKKIEAIIRHNRLEAISGKLNELGFHGMTVSEVQGFGRQKGQTETYRGAEYNVDFVPKLKVEIVTDDGDAQQVIDTIVESARTGAIGDGKIFITDLADAIRIRTAEAGAAAL